MSGRPATPLLINSEKQSFQQPIRTVDQARTMSSRAKSKAARED